MFKLLAIRPLEGCASHIQKCLKTGLMYYFCNDYIIEPGSHIRRRSKNIKPLKEDFFTVVSESDNNDDNSSNETSPTVSVSAIVGMNGDGKSTLVELMMRLINNCAISYKLCISSDNIKGEDDGKKEPHYNLRRVKGAKAELYYMIDNVVYRMAEEKGQEETKIWKVSELNPFNEKGEELMRWEIDSAEIQKVEDDPKGFFFTIVSNYSHYAYNIYDYEKEWEICGGEKDDDEKCWLHYIFHKNDGYLTPITLHPYRYKGNIDINVEKDLSKQRLLSLFLNADNPSENPLSFRRVRGKDASVLKLTEELESKLQQKAIIEYFKATNQENRFKTVLEEIDKVDKEIDIAALHNNSDNVFLENYKKLVDGILQSFYINPINQIIRQSDFCNYVKEIVKWLKAINCVEIQNIGDIRSVEIQYHRLKNKIIQFVHAEIYNIDGEVLFHKSDKTKAVRKFNKAIMLAPTFVKAYNNRGNVRLIMNDLSGALMDFDKVIELRPDYAEAYCSRGIVHEKLEKWGDSLIDFGRAIELNPKYGNAYFNRSVVKNKLGDYDGSMIDYEKANELGYSLDQAWSVVAPSNEEREVLVKIASIIKSEKPFFKFKFLKSINAIQLGRLDTLYRIMKSYNNIDWRIVAKNYSDLSLEEKCQHYCVYKIWSILSTYPKYQDAYKKDSIESLREYGLAMEKYIEMIKTDESHITRKLRQVNNFMNEKLHGGGLYERLGKRDERKQDDLLVEIDKLKEYYRGKPIPLDNLPPPIYKWDIIFKKQDDPNCDIELDSFSSGEKQLLYSIGAIVYHLQNLNHTSSGVKYNNVNLIMEEIELYYHPEYQRQFFNRLLDLIQRAKLENIQNISIVFVTHSPFILSDIPKSNVLFLKEGMPKDIMQENTFGANIHTLLKNGFFMPNLPIGEFAYGKINKLFGKLNSGELDPDNDLDEIYQEILLVGEPFLRNQLLMLYNSYKGSRVMPVNKNKKGIKS